MDKKLGQELVSVLRVGAVAWPIEKLESWEQWVEKVEAWVTQAADQKAGLLLFPEYGSLELSSLFPEKTAMDPQACIQLMQEFWPAWRGLWADLARRHSLTIAAPSFPLLKKGQLTNRVLLNNKEGLERWQDKVVMTPFEKEWRVRSGGEIKVFEEGNWKVGIAVCYDSEFPLLARRQAEAGMSLLLVPSNTETVQGYWRVRVGAQARALENQCFVVQSVTVGAAPWSGLIEENCGAAGIYGPPESLICEEGVLAKGEMNTPGWVFADLSLEKVKEVREAGQVRNFQDWMETEKCLTLSCE